LSQAPPDHLAGHVWVQELIDGGVLRFQVADARYLRFGDATTEFAEPPLASAAAVGHVQETFDRSAYLKTVDRPERYTFLAVATRRQGIDYDWERIPPALGTAIWDDEEARWLPPDRVASVFDRLGPQPVNTVDRELSVERRDLSGYETPESAWYDGPAAGVVFADKHGARAVLRNPEAPSPPAPVDGDPAALVERFLTDDLLRRVAESGADRGPEALFERVLERLFREQYALLVDDGEPVVPVGAFRSAAAERVRRWHDDHVA
jgi:hypothetical protein